jgi:hypothetical protein
MTALSFVTYASLSYNRENIFISEMGRTVIAKLFSFRKSDPQNFYFYEQSLLKEWLRTSTRSSEQTQF